MHIRQFGFGWSFSDAPKFSFELIGEKSDVYQGPSIITHKIYYYLDTAGWTDETPSLYPIPQNL